MKFAGDIKLGSTVITGDQKTTGEEVDYLEDHGCTNGMTLNSANTE